MNAIDITNKLTPDESEVAGMVRAYNSLWPANSFSPVQLVILIRMMRKQNPNFNRRLFLATIEGAL